MRCRRGLWWRRWWARPREALGRSRTLWRDWEKGRVAAPKLRDWEKERVAAPKLRLRPARRSPQKPAERPAEARRSPQKPAEARRSPQKPAEATWCKFQELKM